MKNKYWLSNIGILRVSDWELALKLQNMVHLLSYVCQGLLHEGSNNCILRVTYGDYQLKLQNMAHILPYVR